MAENNGAENNVSSVNAEAKNVENKNSEARNFRAKDKSLVAFDCLAVTQVQVFPFKEGPSLGHMKGLAQVVLNDQMIIRGLRIMDGEYGLFVSYPLDPFFKGEEYKSICNPLTRQLREHIENCVLEKYQAAVA